MKIKKINIIGFNRDLQMFEKLFKEDIIDEKYGFLIEYKEKIQKLNNLRKRILHRGIYILPYKELDIFIVKRILPIIIEIIKIEFVEDNEKIGRGKF